jgi:hypothetical protein
VSELGFFLLVFGVQYTCDDQRGKEVCDPIATSRRDITCRGEEPVLAEDREKLPNPFRHSHFGARQCGLHALLTNHDIAP